MQGPFTVTDARGEYLKAFERRGGKSVYETRRASGGVNTYFSV